MKRFCAVLAVCVAVLAGCPTDDGNGNGDGGNGGNGDGNGGGGNGTGDNSDVIGIWTAMYDNTGEVKLDIADKTWVLVFTDPDGDMVTYNGKWTRNGNVLTLSLASSYRYATASLSGGKLILDQSWNTEYSRPGTSELTKGGSSGGTGNATLKINNQSSVELTDVSWSNVPFNDIGIGANKTVSVTAGQSYIYFTRKTNSIKARTKEMVIIEKGETKDFPFTDNTLIVDVDNPNRSGTLATLQPVSTTLKINNQSFTEITDVIWQNVSFANNNYENSIKPSTNVINTVQAGGGYIFFKRKSNPITARTGDLIVIENGENIEFTFTDNTVIVEINNPNNNGTLGALQSTVVWWDDAEGEMQPYYEARSKVMYYTENDLSGVKNGKKSVAIGGTTTAMMHLKINLARSAKLSFWYANMNNSNITGNAVFSINGVEKRSWASDINWSFIEFELEAGLNDLIWEKRDGYDSSYNSYSYYLTLDDILIYYTE